MAQRFQTKRFRVLNVHSPEKTPHSRFPSRQHIKKHPVFQAEIERWDPKLGQIVTEYIDISPNTSRKLFKLFADPKIFLSIPELGRLIADTLGEKDVELVAKNARLHHEASR